VAIIPTYSVCRVRWPRVAAEDWEELVSHDALHAMMKTAHLVKIDYIELSYPGAGPFRYERIPKCEEWPELWVIEEEADWARESRAWWAQHIHPTQKSLWPVGNKSFLVPLEREKFTVVIEE